MRTNIFFRLLTLCAVLMVAGCENDIDLNADDTSGLLCINGYLTAGADNNVVNVSVTGKTMSKSIPNARVEVRVNGILEQTIDGYDNNGGLDDTDYYYFNCNYKVTAQFNPGDRVQIDVYYDGQHAYGGGIVPQPVTQGSIKVEYGQNITYKRNSWSDDYSSDDMAMVAVTFADADANSKNYYRMAISQSDTVTSRIDENGWYLNHYGWEMSCRSEIYPNDSQYYIDGYDFSYNEYDYYFDNDPVLSAEVVKNQGDLIFMNVTDNIYKIFTDNFFNGSTITLNVMRCLNFYIPEKYYCISYNYNMPHDYSYYAPHYTHKVNATVYSITDDEYYYLKVLNARGPGSYNDDDEDIMSSLTGDVKLPSNVSGGSGNIFLSSCATISGYLFTDYVPEYGGSDYLW